jgi:ribulose-bisphosphate carboxylase large chain
LQDDWLSATYLVETPTSLERAAETIAGEQSSGTFVAIAGETAELRARHGAVVEAVAETGESPHPSLTGRYPAGATFRRGTVTIRWPLANIGASLPNVLPAIAGNLTELKDIAGVRLLDLEVPAALAAGCPMPRFSIDGTRRLAGVQGRPIIGTIVKPSVGLSPAETGAFVHELALAGIDFVKDDELIASPPYSPLEDRVATVMSAVDYAADTIGRKVMVAFNITGEVDEMRRRHDAVLAAGGTCVMVCLNAVGLAGVMALARHAELPIHGHRAGWGALTRHPALGLEFVAYQKLWRLAGVDQLHVNGLDSKFWEPNDSVVRSVRACLEPIADPCDRAMPVLSSGQWGGQAPETYRQLQTVDLLYLAGGGIAGHPDGPAAGVAAIRDAWDAAVDGIPLADYARTHHALAKSMATFGAS